MHQDRQDGLDNSFLGSMHRNKKRRIILSPNPSFLCSRAGCRIQDVLKNSSCKSTEQPNLSLEVVLSRLAGLQK